jgi:hypothetical protein
LFFAEPDKCSPGDRIQSISVQGQVALSDFEVLSKAGEPMSTVVHSINDVAVQDVFTLTLSATHGTTLISGVELVRHE